MGTLIEFAKRLEEQLANAKREPHWDAQQADCYMAEVRLRHQQFSELAMRLSEEVIQPRLELLGGYFPNASLGTSAPTGHCDCWFGYCERFPATTKVSFAIEHDVRFENVSVCYHAIMTPQFITLPEHDRMTLPLNEVRVDQVEPWIETRLVEFLDAYLRIDRGGEDFDSTVVSDPVCGMRISKSSAVASDEYLGHPYYFCSKNCRETFIRDPTSYVTVKTM